MATLIALAAQLSAAFVTDKRDNGAEFYKLAEGSPQWMTDAIHAAHGDMLPDDFRYEHISHIAGRIADLDDDSDLDDARGEIVDSLVDVYNAKLTAWLNSHGTRFCYCDDAAEEFGFEFDAQSGGTIKLLQLGQYAELDEIWGQLVGFLETLAEDDDDTAEDDDDDDAAE